MVLRGCRADQLTFVEVSIIVRVAVDYDCCRVITVANYAAPTRVLLLLVYLWLFHVLGQIRWFQLLFGSFCDLLLSLLTISLCPLTNYFVKQLTSGMAIYNVLVILIVRVRKEVLLTVIFGFCRMGSTRSSTMTLLCRAGFSLLFNLILLLRAIFLHFLLVFLQYAMKLLSVFC